MTRARNLDEIHASKALLRTGADSAVDFLSVIRSIQFNDVADCGSISQASQVGGGGGGGINLRYWVLIGTKFGP